MKGCMPLTDAQLLAAREAMGGYYRARNRALFMLGCYSGFRVSELCSLRVRDVMSGGRVATHVTVARRHMKRKTESRTVMIAPQARPYLAAHVALMRARGFVSGYNYLFRSRAGDRPISISQAWRILAAAQVAAGAPSRGTHAMRKSFADRIYRTLLARQAAGEPVDAFRLTSKALGHKDIKSTDQYLGFLVSDIEQAICAL
ncbi:MAG: tyrosine-type recombinase/integrase [Desulfovibrionaceae bacterium]